MNKPTYDRIFGYDGGCLVAIAIHIGGEAWSVWDCRSVGHRDANVDTLGVYGEKNARKIMCADRTVLNRGTGPRPATPVAPPRLEEKWYAFAAARFNGEPTSGIL